MRSQYMPKELLFLDSSKEILKREIADSPLLQSNPVWTVV